MSPLQGLLRRRARRSGRTLPEALVGGRRRRRSGRALRNALARRRLRSSRLAPRCDPRVHGVPLIAAARAARRRIVLSDQPRQFDQGIRPGLPRSRSPSARCFRGRGGRVRAHATVSIVRHACPSPFPECHTSPPRLQLDDGRSRPAQMVLAQAYRISIGAPTPSSPSPKERTVAMPSTNARRAKVISLSSWIINRKYGESLLPRVHCAWNALARS